MKSVELVGLVASPPPEDSTNSDFQEMMESFVDLDQFLLGEKIMTQHSPQEFINPVNRGNDNTASCNEEHTHNLTSEVKFNDAWDILNAMESDSHATFESILNSISTMEKPLQENNTDNLTTPTNNTPGLDVSTLLANVPILPFDVNTPDVDTNILTSDIPEFFSSSMVEKSELSSSTEALIIDKQTQDTELADNDNETNSLSSSNQPILTLNIGQTLDNLFVGNGARLQLKRKASNNLTIPKVEVDTVQNGHEKSNDNVVTIVIKFSNNDDNQQQEAVLSPKKPRYEEKYDEMRRKNNAASRRCRLNRKGKQKDMTLAAEQLEEENKKLQETVNQLEREIQATKAQFIKMFQSKLVK